MYVAQMPRRDKQPELSGPISMPHQWAPMPHQLGLWNAVALEGYKRAVAVWHRRAGKDSTAINLMATLAVVEPGLYYYMAPNQRHARRIIWDNIGRDGRRIINQAFPEALRKSTNDQEMRIVLEANGGESIFQVVGSDNYDSLVGTNPRGIIFSEWSIADKPEAWEYFSPILMENKGWAIFIYTPRGINHGYKTYHAAQEDPTWFCEMLTIDDTKIVNPEDVQREIDMGHMSPIKARQEFWCDFLQSTETQVFDPAAVLACMQRDQGDVYDPNAPVIMGIDVAYAGDDRTVIAVRTGRDGRTVPPLVIKEGQQRQQANRIYAFAQEIKPDAIVVDRTGPGHGMYEILRHEMRLPVYGVHFGQGAQRAPEKYHDIRTELACEFAEWCREPDTLLPDDKLLREEMLAIRYLEEPDTRGRLRLESKRIIKDSMGRSPDLADAYLLTFGVRVPRRDAFPSAQNRRTKAKRSCPFD